MRDSDLRPGPQFVNQIVRSLSAAHRRDYRRRLLGAVHKKHGVSGFSLLLEALEEEHGDLKLDRHIERVVDADPRAIALFGASR